MIITHRGGKYDFTKRSEYDLERIERSEKNINNRHMIITHRSGKYEFRLCEQSKSDQKVI